MKYMDCKIYAVSQLFNVNIKNIMPVFHNLKCYELNQVYRFYVSVNASFFSNFSMNSFCGSTIGKLLKNTFQYVKPFLNVFIYFWI